MIRRPPRSTRVRSSAASDVYKRQQLHVDHDPVGGELDRDDVDPRQGQERVECSGDAHGNVTLSDTDLRQPASLSIPCASPISRDPPMRLAENGSAYKKSAL